VSYTANIVYKGERDIDIIDDTLAEATTETFGKRLNWFHSTYRNKVGQILQVTLFTIQ
jgi:hypothetical protein